jgi:hypothetical protein
MIVATNGKVISSHGDGITIIDHLTGRLYMEILADEVGDDLIAVELFLHHRLAVDLHQGEELEDPIEGVKHISII